MTVASTLPAHPLAHYRAEFPIFERRVYLNTCSLGALSKRSRDRLDEFLGTWDDRGASAWYDEWWQALDQLRSGYARLIGASAAEIALHASVSTATAVLASALDYRRRPKVVTTSLDFPTVVYQWLAKRELGVELVVVESPDGVTVPLECLAEAVDERTALVATSHVYYTSGAIQDIAAVAKLAHTKGALCYIDAYQSVGQLPFDVRRTGVDFLSAGGLKWLLGGPGIVFLYVRRELMNTLRPSVTGWFASARQFEFEARRLEWHEDARRFEQGTPALAAVHTQLGGLEIVEEIGVPAIRSVTTLLTDDLVSRARDAGLRLKVASQPNERASIVAIAQADPADAVRRLAAVDVIADARPGHVRLSPYFYNLAEDHAAAIEVLVS